MKRAREGLKKKNKSKQTKKVSFTALATVIKKNLKMPIRKHASELKVHEKIVRSAIKQDLSPDLNHLDYFLENKTNATSYPNIVSLKMLLSRNGIKYLKNSFWRHEIRFEGLLIQ